MTKLRPPPVAVKTAITEAILNHNQSKVEDNAPLHEMFPNGWAKVIDQALATAYDGYKDTKLGAIELQLERIENAFKQ